MGVGRLSRGVPGVLAVFVAFFHVAWAGSRFQIDAQRMEPAVGLSRNTSTQVESGLIAAWAGNLPPDPPTDLSVSVDAYTYTPGEVAESSTVVLTFTLADPDPGDRVRYVLGVSTLPNFALLVASRTSAQAVAPGRYSGVVGPLAEGWYWWRVKAVDASGLESSWTLANGGQPGFGVDDDPPRAMLEVPAASGAVVSVGKPIEVRGWVKGQDLASWTLTVGDKSVAEGRGEVSGQLAMWQPSGPPGLVNLTLTARDTEGFAAVARAQVVVSTTGRPAAGPAMVAGLAEEAFAFRSAGLGPNPARAGTMVSCHLAVGRADTARAAFYTSAGELVRNEDAPGPVWHGGQLCYEPALDTRALAAGVYLLAFEAEKDGQPAVRVIRKLLVIK